MTDVDLLRWVDDLLAATGHHRAGDLVLHRDRSWSRIYTAPTDHGLVWVKVATPSTAAEVALYPLLAATAPDCVLVPLGTDLDRGWLLLPDAGPSLHDQLSGQPLVDAMTGALRRYARLQHELAPRVADVLACGVTDMGPTALPGRFEDALAAVAPHAEGSGADLDLRRLHDLRPAYAESCAEFGEPATLRPVADLACRVALVARALVWLRALGPAPTDSDYAHAPFAHLRRLLDP